MTIAATPLTAPFTSDERGVVRIGSTQVMLERVVHAFDEGASAEEVVETYPTLDLGDVYATIAFILKNRAEIDAYMAASDEESEHVQREREERYPTGDLRRRLRARAARRGRDLLRALETASLSDETLDVIEAVVERRSENPA